MQATCTQVVYTIELEKLSYPIVPVDSTYFITWVCIMNTSVLIYTLCRVAKPNRQWYITICVSFALMPGPCLHESWLDLLSNKEKHVLWRGNFAITQGWWVRARWFTMHVKEFHALATLSDVVSVMKICKVEDTCYSKPDIMTGRKTSVWEWSCLSENLMPSTYTKDGSFLRRRNISISKIASGIIPFQWIDSASELDLPGSI